MTEVKGMQNFRQAAGIGNVYRSATTDILGEVDASNRTAAEKFVFEKIGFVVDLRGAHEINEQTARKWMDQAPPQGIKLIDTESSDSYDVAETQRIVVRVNVLSMPRLMAYVDKEWLNEKERKKAADLERVGSSQEKLMLRIEKLNERGLLGLNQLILDSGGTELCRALKLITLRLEANPEDEILVHCVQGKDRTGMLVMLLQSILGFSDDVIVDDYFASDNTTLFFGSAAVAATVGERHYGKLDRTLFSRATKDAMVQTLAYMRQKHGSVSPGYLDHIGFNDDWRRRIFCRLKASNQSRASRM